MSKYVFITGGVVSGLGKGITASSIALLLKSRGFKVFMQKFDPYLNVDPGTMSPYQHGEVFVTADGTETDLDLGHYERFTDVELNYASSVSMGRIFSNILENERKGDYLGGTVQFVPHVTNEIKKCIFESENSINADIVITEIGGTVGDIEGLAILEALRQIRYDLGPENTVLVHTTLIPFLFGSNELKTKPSQQSVIELRRIGLQPDIIVARAPSMLTDDIKAKLSLFSSIPKENIISAIDVDNIYQVPVNFYHQKIDEIIIDKLKLKIKKIDFDHWLSLMNKIKQENIKEVNIGLVGKYISLHDAYLSVAESLKHAGYEENVKVVIKWIDSEGLEKKNLKLIFKNIDGIIVPGGFGKRGIEGKIKAIKYARENNIPFLGLCLGLQLAAIEFARNVCQLKKANSREFDELVAEPVIDIMEEQKKIINLGGTMRLGNYDCEIKKNTLASKLYKEKQIEERHRHRYEFNNKYIEIFEKNGIVFSGVNKASNLIEILEYKNHPFFIACQFHPEFKSRPIRSHPLFRGFIKASKKVV